jgi:hypothetical protein
VHYVIWLFQKSYCSNDHNFHYVIWLFQKSSCSNDQNLHYVIWMFHKNGMFKYSMQYFFLITYSRKSNMNYGAPDRLRGALGGRRSSSVNHCPKSDNRLPGYTVSRHRRPQLKVLPLCVRHTHALTV